MWQGPNETTSHLVQRKPCLTSPLDRGIPEGENCLWTVTRLHRGLGKKGCTSWPRRADTRENNTTATTMTTSITTTTTTTATTTTTSTSTWSPGPLHQTGTCQSRWQPEKCLHHVACWIVTSTPVLLTQCCTTRAYIWSLFLSTMWRYLTC